MKFYQYINEVVNNFDNLLHQIAENFYKNILVELHKQTNQSQKTNDYEKRLENELVSYELIPYKEKIIKDMINQIFKNPEFVLFLLDGLTAVDDDWMEIHIKILNITCDIYNKYLQLTNFGNIENIDNLGDIVGTSSLIGPETGPLTLALKKTLELSPLKNKFIDKIKKDYINQNPKNIHNILNPTKETLEYIVNNYPWILTDQIFSRCKENCNDLKAQWFKVGKARKQIGL